MRQTTAKISFVSLVNSTHFSATTNQVRFLQMRDGRLKQQAVAPSACSQSNVQLHHTSNKQIISLTVCSHNSICVLLPPVRFPVHQHNLEGQNGESDLVQCSAKKCSTSCFFLDPHTCCSFDHYHSFVGRQSIIQLLPVGCS